MGLLHDLGRFKQWELYQTFNDNLSEDHADISEEILNNINLQKEFNISKKEGEILKLSIKYHTKQYLGSDKQVIKFNNILKNSDAFANVLTTANGAQPMTMTEDGVSEEILIGFKNMEFINRISPKTKLDRALQLTACCYYINNSYLREEILKFNYFDIIFETFSKYLNENDKITYKNAINSVKNKFKK